MLPETTIDTSLRGIRHGERGGMTKQPRVQRPCFTSLDCFTPSHDLTLLFAMTFSFWVSLFIAIVLLFLPFALFAQKADSTKKEKKDFFPTGVRVGTDAISLIRTQTDKSFSGYEFNADVDFYRYYLAVELGKWKRKFSTDVDAYANEGNYMRVGMDINFLKKDPDRNMFFFGARYGWGKYSEVFSTNVNDPVWGADVITFANNDKKSSWGELTTGLRVKMFKFFWMGYTARYKFGLNTNEPSGFVSHDVPGYGKTGNQSTWGFNYQLLFRIPIRKQK